MRGGIKHEPGNTSLADPPGQPTTRPAVGKRALTEQPLVPDVQRSASGQGDGAAVQQTAAQGIAGGGGPMPHLVPIQQLFGRHDVSGVEAHVGGGAETASRAIGAEAYATGNHVVFAGPPDLHTAAHEAAHVVQQRAGVQLQGGVGEAGDPYEQHADAVADAVVQGRSAEGLLDRHAGAGPGAAAATPHADAPVQAKIVGYQSTGSAASDMQKIAAHLDDCVQKAVAIVAASPTLDHVTDADAAGHLAAWVKTYREYLANPNRVPDFFFARYGYAIETLAMRFVGTSYGSYKLEKQVSHGHTRPDLVVEDASSKEMAWLDITSAGSIGHVLNKQHSGWKSKPFVAEIVYDMPIPSALAANSGTLTPEQKQALARADAAAGERAKAFEIASEDYAVAIADDLLAAARRSTGGQISKTAALQVVKATCQRLTAAAGTAPAAAVTAPAAAGIVSLIQELNVGGSTSSGAAWASWMTKTRDVAAARKILFAYGEKKMGTSRGATASSSASQASSVASLSAARPAVDGPVDLNAVDAMAVEVGAGAGAEASPFAWASSTS